MSSREPHDDPELLGLLTELVDQEDRVLLKSAVPRLRRNFYAESVPISPRVAGLSSLERKLLEAYREDLGRLLTDLCFRLLHAHEKLGDRLVLSRSKSGLEVRPQRIELLEQRADALFRRAALLSDAGTSLEVARKLLADSVQGDGDLLRAAEAGMQIAPSEALRVYRGRGLEAMGDRPGAIRLLEHVYRNPTIFLNKIIAAGSIGAIVYEDKDYALAAAWYQHSAGTRVPYALGAVSFLASAIQVGDNKLTDRAARTLGDSCTPTDPMLLNFLSRVRMKRFAGSWHPTPESRNISIKRFSNDEPATKVLKLFE